MNNMSRTGINITDFNKVAAEANSALPRVCVVVGNRRKIEVTGQEEIDGRTF